MATSWAGRLFLDSGHMLYAGPVRPTAVHAHHAFQIVLALQGTVTLRGPEGIDAAECDVAVVPSDAAHAIVVGCSSAVMLYVDPDTLEGRRLRQLAIFSDSPEAWHAAGETLRPYRNVPPPIEWSTAQHLRLVMLETLVGAASHPQARHPALVRALQTLPQRLDGSVRLAPLAAELEISESRLLHLFGEELGLPFRSYVAWLRLRKAATAVQGGSNLARAAHEAGFADAAHFTRTFRRMFGITPSEIAGVVEWVPEPASET